MNVIQLLHSFAADKQISTVFLLVAADLVLGILAAFKTSTFKLSYVTTFLKDDVAFQVFPWLGLYLFGQADAGTLIGGYVTFSDAAKAAFGLIVAQQVASLTTSLNELGLPIPAPVLNFAGPKTKLLVSDSLATLQPFSATAPNSASVTITFGPVFTAEPPSEPPATPEKPKAATKPRASRAKPKTPPAK